MKTCATCGAELPTSLDEYGPKINAPICRTCFLTDGMIKAKIEQAYEHYRQLCDARDGAHAEFEATRRALRGAKQDDPGYAGIKEDLELAEEEYDRLDLKARQARWDWEELSRRSFLHVDKAMLARWIAAAAGAHVIITPPVLPTDFSRLPLLQGGPR